MLRNLVGTSNLLKPFIFPFPLQNTKDNPPCNTLFIGNLGENINEEELRGLFSVYEYLILDYFLSCDLLFCFTYPWDWSSLWHLYF